MFLAQDAFSEVVGLGSAPTSIGRRVARNAACSGVGICIRVLFGLLATFLL